MKILFGLSAILVVLAALVSPARADGPLQSDMYTLDEIYYYLTEGAEPAEERPGLDPTSGAPGEDIPGFTKSLADIFEDAKTLFEGCNVTPAQVLEAVTYFSTDTDDWGPRVGTIATRTLSAGSDTVAAGYYASTTLSEVDPDLASGNIKSGVNIFGKAGSVVEATGNAVAADVRSGKTFSKAGSAGLTGTMPNAEWTATAAQILSGKKAGGSNCTTITGTIPSKGAQTYTPGTSNQTITSGQYLSGTQTISGDADLITTNIRSGVNIFGVTGATTVQYIGDANAAAGDVKSGKTFYSVSGGKKTGTLTLAGNATEADVVQGKTFYSNNFSLKTGSQQVSTPCRSLPSGYTCDYCIPAIGYALYINPRRNGYPLATGGVAARGWCGCLGHTGGGTQHTAYFTTEVVVPSQTAVYFDWSSCGSVHTTTKSSIEVNVACSD